MNLKWILGYVKRAVVVEARKTIENATDETISGATAEWRAAVSRSLAILLSQVPGDEARAAANKMDVWNKVWLLEADEAEEEDG